MLASIRLLAVQAQDVEAVIERAKNYEELIKNPFKVNGSVTSMLSYNGIQGIARRMDPFSYQVNAALNLSLWGIKAQFNANFSNGRSIYRYQLPSLRLPSYALLGISPSYKWATLHLGNRNLTFSPYTLSGHSFQGAGLELSPGHFRFSAMYGRLRRALPEDLNTLQSLEPVYKRIGWGLKTGYDNGRDHLYAILFQSWDDPNSIPPVQNFSYVTPAANTIASVQGKKHLSQAVYVAIDFARSAFTRDQQAAALSAKTDLWSTMGGLFVPKVSSGYANAIKSSIGLNTRVANFSINHEWVDPGYRTLGALFFNNDYENITVNALTRLFKNKLAVSANTGVQRNNLKRLESTTLRRFVGAFNLTLTPNDRTQLTAVYSNFQTANRTRTLAIPLLQEDAIILTQTNQNASLNASFFGGKEKNAVLSALFSFQKANLINNEVVQTDQASLNYLSNLSYAYAFMESKLTLSASMLANYNELQNIGILSISPSVSAAKRWLNDKLSTHASGSYIRLFTDGVAPNQIFSIQSGGQYTLAQKSNLALNLAWVKRLGISTHTIGSPSFSEFNGRLTYNWRF